MIITKKALQRRTFLRGLGTTLALPLLNAMIPSMTAQSATAANPVRRLGFIYIPMGTIISQWTPSGPAGVLGELSPMLRSLTPYKDQLNVFTNMELKNATPIGVCDNGYACVYQNNLSWSLPTPRCRPKRIRAVFERLFGEVGSAAERSAELRKSASLLDWMTADIARLQRKLGPDDRNKVSEYLDTVREVEPFPG